MPYPQALNSPSGVLPVLHNHQWAGTPVSNRWYYWFAGSPCYNLTEITQDHTIRCQSHALSLVFGDDPLLEIAALGLGNSRTLRPQLRTCASVEGHTSLEIFSFICFPSFVSFPRLGLPFSSLPFSLLSFLQTQWEK